MGKKYLDEDGVRYNIGRIKAALQTKVDKETGKGLSTNDFTNTYKNQLDNLGTSSTKDYTGTVTENSTDLVESGAVYDVIDDVTEQIALKQDAIIHDDTTDNKYRLGVDNGLLYIETVE